MTQAELVRRCVYVSVVYCRCPVSISVLASRCQGLISVLLSTEDGRVTLAEWVVRWVCAYSDTGAFARFLWERVFQNATSVSAPVAPMPPFGQGFIVEDC